MHLLLSNFNNDNKDLSELLINYQEYFVFKKELEEKKEVISLYLDIERLYNYLETGKEIKYRKFIFLFLENLNNKKKNKNYYMNYDKYNIKLNNLIEEDILNNEDLKNIRHILNIINYLNKNNINIKNNQIYNLDNKLYIDLNRKIFMNKKNINNYKFDIKTKGFIINNHSYLRNLIIILNCINNEKNNKSVKINRSRNIVGLEINTKCNLVISSKIKIELFINEITKNNKNIKYIEINNIDSFKNYTYIDVKNYQYIFININIINN